MQVLILRCPYSNINTFIGLKNSEKYSLIFNELSHFFELCHCCPGLSFDLPAFLECY